MGHFKRRQQGQIKRRHSTNASQHELQFYRGLMEDPVVKLAAKVGILTSLLASRIEGIAQSEAEELTAPLGELTRR